MSKEVAEEYVSSLAELTNNSKPHINMLTMLADDNIEHAPAIVDAVEKHLQKVPPDIKLPVLYLIDSIVKNVGRAYTELFSQNIVDMFCDVFAKVDEKTRAQMFKLRQTWNSVFPLKNLFVLDTKVNKMDPAWPITAHPTIHVNPKFFNVSSSSSSTAATPPAAQASTAVLSAADAAMKEQLLKQQKKLLELQQERLELELMQTKAKLEEQQKQLEKQTGHLKSADSLSALSKLIIKKDGGKFTVHNTKSSKQSIITSSQSVLTKSQFNKTASKMEVKPTAEVKPTEAVKSSVTKVPEQSVNKSNILLKPYAAADVKPASKSETIDKFKSVAKSSLKTETKVKIQEAVPGKTRGMPEPWNVPAPTQQVRIAPVSSQLISAARRARDPRIRKLENVENTPVTSVSGFSVNSSHVAVGTKSSSAAACDSSSSRDAAVVKTKTKTETNIDHSKSGKNRKDKKCSSHRSREEKWQKKMAKIVKHYKTDKQVGYDKKQTVEETKNIGRSIANNDSKQSDVTEVKIPGKRSSENSEKLSSHKPCDSERTASKNHEETVGNTKPKLQRPAQSIPEKTSLKFQESESITSVKADRSEKFISKHSDIVKPVYNKNSDSSDKPGRTFVNKPDVSQTQIFSDANAANKNFSDSDKQTKSVDSMKALVTHKASDKSSLEKLSENLPKCTMDFERIPYVPENVNTISSKFNEQIASPKREFANEHTKVAVVDDKTSTFLVSDDKYNTKTDCDERTLLVLDSKVTSTKLKSDSIDDMLKKPLSNEELDRRKSPQFSDKRLRRSDQKMTIMEKMLASTEVDEASPSPPPPPVISDKFKEVKPSSLSRLRKYGRNRDGSESPPATPTITTTMTTTAVVATTVADVDLRQPPVPLIGDQKNEVVSITASADKDVDLRQLPSSPKKRSSVDRSEPPPSKKSKAEMFHELFGSEDVDLRPQLSGAPLPSPPPPPIISRSPPPPSNKEDKENASERLWAKYKQQKPDSFKSSYKQNVNFKSSPAFRRGQGPFAQYDRRRLLSQEDEDSWHSGRQWYGEDTDMRTSFIIHEANKQLKTGNITELQYQKVLSEVVTMNEKQKLAEAQFKDEEEERMLYERNEELEPISDDEGSFTGSLSPTQNDEVISSVSDPNSSSKPDRDSESSNADQANLEPYDPGDSVMKHDSADVDHRMYTKGERKLRSGILEVASSCPENDNRIPMDVSHPDSTNEAVEVTYKRYPNQREDQRGQRQDRKQRRRKEDRDHRDKPYRKTRFNQIGPGNWVPFDGRHKNIDSQMNMEYSDSRIPHKDFIHNQMISPDMSIRNKSTTDNRNFQDGSDMSSYPVSMHSSRYGNDTNLIETGLKDYPPIHSVGPWDRSRQPAVWMRGTAPPLLRIPPPLLMRPPGYTSNRWRMAAPGLAPMRPLFALDIRYNRFLPPSTAGRYPLPQGPGEIPPSDPVILAMIAADPTVSICIDSKLRDIRFYGDTGVALMDWDDPREISFVSGQRRKVIIDDRESFILTFNTPYKDVLIDGQPHRIKLGAPTRELYIDGKFYEIRFGGPPVNIDIGGKIRSVQLDGPTPTVVRPGIKRSDLVVGKIKLIVDAQIYFPIFLDAKPQRFDIEGIPYILQFVQALQTVLINGVPFKAEFGGLPKPIVLNGKKHFFRLSSLPRGVTPGHITIVNMEGGRLPTPPPPVLPPPPQIPLALQLPDMDIEQDNNSRSSDSVLRLTSEPNLASPSLAPVEGSVTTDITNVNTEGILNPQVQKIPIQPPVPDVSAPAAPAPSNPLDMLTSLMPTNPPPQVNYSYSVENDVPATTSAESASQQTQTQSQATGGMIPFLTGEINVSELLQKLVASGIVPSPFEPPKTPNKEKPAEPESNAIKPVDFLKTETLKTRQPGLIATLYSGIQCSSCGVRFAPEQTMKYSQHLDWHFRQNRRDKDSARTAQSRKWYYDVSDWIQFEEIEDLEERAQSWFESQAGQNNINAEVEEPAKEIPSVAAGEFGEDAACEICRDKFEQFYNEEREEWHLRQAIKVDNKLYHPICHQDYRASLDAPIDISLDESTPKEDEAEPASAVVDDDDDGMDVIECEIITPEVPFEDLTVSDCESVHDEKEEKPKKAEAVETEASNSQNAVNDAETKPEGSEPTKSEDVVDIKDDASEDVTGSDFETVVKNIKKEPVDVDDNETNTKNEKEDVPLPEPVVDTTHVEVSCTIDGNLQFEENLQLAVSAPPKIKINITKPLTVHAPRDSKESESDVTDDAETPTTNSGTSIVAPPPQTLLDQPPPPGEEPTPIILPRKPRLVGKKLQELPPVSKGTELSGLCSIM